MCRSCFKAVTLLSLGLYEDGALIGIALGRVRHWCTGTEY